MEDHINEVTIVEQDLLMTVDDFAKQERVTPRTVYRWIEQGRLDIVERLGKKYVNASVPLKTPINDSDNDRHDMTSKNAGALQNVNIFEEYLKTMRDNGKRFQKSCRRWQIACFTSFFLFIVALLASTALSLIYHYGLEGMNEKLEASSAEIVRLESEKESVLAKLEETNAKMDLKLKPYLDENTRLQQRLDKAISQNDGLRDRLDETFDRNTILLQRVAEQGTIDEVVMIEPSSNDAKSATP